MITDPLTGHVPRVTRDELDAGFRGRNFMITDRDIETYKTVGAIEGVIECAEIGYYPTRESLIEALKRVIDEWKAGRHDMAS